MKSVVFETLVYDIVKSYAIGFIGKEISDNSDIDIIYRNDKDPIYRAIAIIDGDQGFALYEVIYNVNSKICQLNLYNKCDQIECELQIPFEGSKQ